MILNIYQNYLVNLNEANHLTKLRKLCKFNLLYSILEKLEKAIYLANFLLTSINDGLFIKMLT